MIEETLFDGTPPPVPPPPPPPTPLPVRPPAPVPAPAPARSFSLPSHLTTAQVWVVVLALFLGLSLAGNLGVLHRPHFAPATVSAPLKATLVYDADGSNPRATAAAIRGDADLAPALKALNCSWRAYDSTSPVLVETNLKHYVDEAGGPPVLIVQVEGVAIPPVHTKAPATSAGVLATIREIRGTR